MKAFNCVGSARMVDPDFRGARPTMFYCGNDAGCQGDGRAGPRSVRLGRRGHGRRRSAARAIEPLAMLWCIPGFLRDSWTHAFICCGNTRRAAKTSAAYSRITPARAPAATASARVDTPSLWNSAARCVFTVCRQIPSRAAICLLTSPSASSARIWASRAVSGSGGAAGAGGGALRQLGERVGRQHDQPRRRGLDRRDDRVGAGGAREHRAGAVPHRPHRPAAGKRVARATRAPVPRPARRARARAAAARAPRSTSASTTAACACLLDASARLGGVALPPPTATCPRLPSSASSPARSSSDRATTSTRITPRALPRAWRPRPRERTPPPRASARRCPARPRSSR